MDELAKELTVSAMPEGLYKQIAETIGAENFYKLAALIGGTTIYVPKPESLLRPLRDAHIKEEFNGYNHEDLAKKYNVTVRWVRELCGQGALEGQIDWFDSFMNL